MSQSTRSACPACGHDGYKSLFHGTDRLYRTTDRGFTVVECAKCRLMRLFPQPRPSELSQFYPAQYWFSPGDSPAARAEERERALERERAIVRDGVEDFF